MGLDRQRLSRVLGDVVGMGGERVSPRSQHALGKFQPECVGLRAQVPEHCVGFPSAKQLDVVGVDAIYAAMITKLAVSIGREPNKTKQNCKQSDSMANLPLLLCSSQVLLGTIYRTYRFTTCQGFQK